MDPSSRHGFALFRAFGVLILSAVFTACGGGTNSVQSSSSSSSVAHSDSLPAATTTLAVSSTDLAAGTSFQKTFKYHIFPIHQSGTIRPAATRTTATNYPADLQNLGGTVIPRATSYNIYINCKSTCWGDPQGFIDRLNNSLMIHISDQYVGTTVSRRYGFGGNIAVSQTLYTNYLSQGDLVSIVHAAAARFGGGYTHIYNVFIPYGVDTCFEETTKCYSPDNTSANQFCAYHASGTFSDTVGHVVFTVLPFQDVQGCQNLGGPNSSLVDSTDSAISHEYFETLTDPDTGAGYYNLTFNQEIGDLCQSYLDIDNVDGARYLLQEEYSNRIHGCTNGG